jgi:hypothetical protein
LIWFWRASLPCDFFPVLSRSPFLSILFAPVLSLCRDIWSSLLSGGQIFVTLSSSVDAYIITIINISINLASYQKSFTRSDWPVQQ